MPQPVGPIGHLVFILIFTTLNRAFGPKPGIKAWFLSSWVNPSPKFVVNL
jgi:hypothetical protein